MILTGLDHQPGSLIATGAGPEMISLMPALIGPQTDQEHNPAPVTLPARLWALARPAAIVLAIRALCLLATMALCAANHRPFDFKAWDGVWYLGIAEHGYTGFDPALTYDAQGNYYPDAPMAFFPGYPLLVRLFGPLFGGNLLPAAIALSLSASIAAGYGVARLARHAGAARRGRLAAVALTAGAPLSVVYTMPYPEAVLVALAAWTLVAVLERRWLLAGLGAAAAGIVSPMAAGLIPVVIVTALAGMDRDRPTWRSLWRFTAATLCSISGMAGYLLWVRTVSPVPGGYFGIERKGWNTSFDFGSTTAQWAAEAVLRGGDVLVVATAAAIVAAIPALILSFRYLPGPVWLYTLATLGVALGSGGLEQDRLRLLLAAFPVLIALAVRVARTSRGATIVTTTAVVVCGLWLSAYSLSGWRYAI